MLHGYATWSRASAHAGKTIWSCLSPRWRLVFLSAQCSTVCCLANNRTHSCLSGSFNTRTVNQIGKRTRGTNRVCEKGPIERRRLLSRLGSVYILFWCKITEKRWSLFLFLNYLPSGHTDNEFTHVSLFAPPLTWKHADAQESKVTLRENTHL